ncbi:MAG: TrkA family potassium uptake protein [Dehalococcoidales bacterium]|nr:TrkA family potassium uptake protein [Dehalococcoidales bacterium]
MKKQIIVIGLGRFGRSIAKTLHGIGHDVLAIDTDEKIVQGMASEITHSIQADGTNENLLRELGIGNFDIAIVAIGSSIENSVLSTILLKKLGVPQVITRADNNLHGSILEKIGADRVVYPEQEMGERVAHVVTLMDVSYYMPLVHGYGVARLEAPPYLIGGKLSELGFGPKGKWEVAVLLIQREKEIIVTPSQQEIIKDGDNLIVAGNNDRLERLLEEAKKGKPQ